MNYAITMDISIYKCKNSRFLATHSMPTTKFPPHVPILAQIQGNLKSYPSTELKLNRQLGHKVVVDCAKTDGCLVAELETEFSSDEIWVFNKYGNCQERRGIVELMECLETEAIMGKDEGKEASDYNRRAQIFDKSSKVFQAFKEKAKESLSSSSSSTSLEDS